METGGCVCWTALTRLLHYVRNDRAVGWRLLRYVRNDRIVRERKKRNGYHIKSGMTKDEIKKGSGEPLGKQFNLLWLGG